ncbi:MAG: ABC transporter permease subunit [Mesorhizobium sp.]
MTVLDTRNDWAGWSATRGMSRGTVAALVALCVGAVCWFAAPYLPWLSTWPQELTLPAVKWIGLTLTGLFEVIKPAARLISSGLAYPMRWANLLLVSSPYSLTIGIVIAFAWYLGGLRMAALAIIGLGFVLFSGYWIPGMNTLSLVLVSVPIALISGAVIGLIAYEFPKLNRPIQTTLDGMQTIPTFAYLTPLLLLFGFGPVVGLIASVIYAAPPMARNLLLGLQRVEPEIREAAVMSGATRWQQLFLIEVPSAAQQTMIGVNQTIMASLSMVIIAAVIGGFNDIGWEVLLTMRKAAFGQSLVAGLVIVIFAILLDRMSSAFASEAKRYSSRVAWVIAALAIILSLAGARWLPAPQDYSAFKGVITAIDQYLGTFISTYTVMLESMKNGAMYYFLLPLRIGLIQSVLPFTWGFQWMPWMSAALMIAAGLIAAAIARRGNPAGGLSLVIAAAMLLTGIVNLPWPFVLIGLGALGWASGGWQTATYAVLMILAVAVIGLWTPALQSIYLCGAAVLACVIVGGAIGALCALSERSWRIIRPVCDLLQTIPLFVFLIPVLMFFQIGEFSAFLAICAYAVVPMVRYTRHGLISTPEELVEAAISSGTTEWQLIREVRIPYAVPTILLGLNQTILYAFSMLVIAALVGTTDLGQQIYLALGQGDVGLGVAAGVSMAILALIADRLVQAFAEKQKMALGL